jgi:uncharacterized membrane protein
MLVAAIPSFLATLVEAVEALTIVLAVGLTRGWRSALIGVAAALVTLAIIVGIFGSAILMFVPIDLLRLVVGGFLIIFGLQWLTKAILRAAGIRAKHDEEAIYRREVAGLEGGPTTHVQGMDWIAFTVAFKGVLLEGMEVAFIVVTFGASAGDLGSAAVGAALAAALVTVVGIVLHRPLARVPENGLKFAVGILLVTFGTFWAGEGIGIDWPTEDLAIVVIAVAYAAAALAAVWLLRSRAASENLASTSTSES